MIITPDGHSRPEIPEPDTLGDVSPKRVTFSDALEELGGTYVLDDCPVCTSTIRGRALKATGQPVETIHRFQHEAGITTVTCARCGHYTTTVEPVWPVEDDHDLANDQLRDAGTTAANLPLVIVAVALVMAAGNAWLTAAAMCAVVGGGFLAARCRA